ncbi:hypothetical protein ACLMJK_002526 [Lecanora helva]
MPDKDSSFLALPKEIRLLIYEYLLKPRYVRHWPTALPDLEPNDKSLNMLRTCHTVYHEFADLLSTRSVFRFRIYPNGGSEPLTQLLGPKPSYQYLRHIQVTSSMFDVGSGVSSGLTTADRQLPALLHHFSTSYPRSTFSMLFNPIWNCISCVSKSHDVEVLQALSGLVGFDSVELQFRVPLVSKKKCLEEKPWREVAARPRRTVMASEQIDECVVRVMLRLELALGEWTISDIEARGLSYARRVELRPSRNLASRRQPSLLPVCSSMV